MEKQYFIDGKRYTFDVVEETEVKVPMWYAKCQENGKMAWIDCEGVQFEGEKRVQATTENSKSYLTYEYDPRYPEDCAPITRFHINLEEARSYAKRIEQEFDGDICVDIFEVERKN